MSEIFMWNYPRGFHKEKRGKNTHRKFSFIFPEVLQGNYHGDDPLGFPIYLCENLRGVDGLATGH